MAMSTFLRGAGLLAVLTGQAAGSSVTPVEKVVQLLTGLQDKVEGEGKKEAIAYDKYACFCKEQVGGKTYSIEKSEATINTLEAEIGDLGSQITALSGDISTLSGEIDDISSNIGDISKTRKDDHATYVGKEEDVSGAIDSIKRAIKELKNSKGQLTGKVDMEVALAQIKVAARSTRLTLPEGRLALLSRKQPGEAYQYEYHANDIIATLEGLLVTFTENKNTLDQEEFKGNSAFEKKRLGLQNEKTFKEREKAEKEKIEAFKEEEKSAKEKDKETETNDKKADQGFLDVLTTNCEEKAAAWDQRSTTRADELTAVSEAIETLKTGVVPKYSANKKLVGLQRSEQVRTGAVAVAAESRRPASFLQLRGSNRRTLEPAAVREEVLALLSGAASHLKSPALSVAALKVQLSKDHFVKVRTIIKDIINKLEDQAGAEATTKSFCDTEMAAAIKLRDEKKEELENLGATISSKEAEKAQLAKDIAALKQAIADNKKALKEATELRQDEKAENEKTIADAQVGLAAVESALKVLKDFYESAAFLQQGVAYVPPDSDRSGKTVADLAPKGFDSSEYKGSQDASKGILGLLEVIRSDFERTETTVDTDEKSMQGDFEGFQTATNTDTESKEGDLDTKKGEVDTLTDALVDLETDQKTAQEALDGALKELEKLHETCVAGEETYEQRAAKREKEIEALKEAHDILENWQG
mmetsp:Transcript_68241/g.154471  ORF Transcript_68241/g.154471 Transcript_68241/m.154471 type:complete len:702 (+) Transcript_68241:70-2175(+)